MAANGRMSILKNRAIQPCGSDYLAMPPNHIEKSIGAAPQSLLIMEKYEEFDAHNAAEARRRWCPFCGTEAVISDAPREMFEDMTDGDDPMTCAGDCYIQGVSIPRSEWPILHDASEQPADEKPPTKP